MANSAIDEARAAAFDQIESPLSNIKHRHLAISLIAEPVLSQRGKVTFEAAEAATLLFLIGEQEAAIHSLAEWYGNVPGAWKHTTPEAPDA